MSAVPLLDVFAICTECGTQVSAWWQRALPARNAELVATERHELALRVRADCQTCDGDTIEIRIEDRTRGSHASHGMRARKTRLP